MDGDSDCRDLHGEDDFSIAFMLSTIYLRLEGKVAPPQMETGIRVSATFYIFSFLLHSCLVQST